MTLLSTVSVDLSGRAYDIMIGAGLLPDAGKRLAALLTGRKICVVTDENVAKLYLIPFQKSCEAAGFTCYPPLILKPGEETKNFHELQNIIDKSLSYKLNRSSALVALGGGVVGDIAGFAAAIIMRGINFIQVPTTLLAQVDSSVGGKTAINTKHGKNLVGTFYQPDLVMIDTDTLKTLPERERKAGYAEILKYALINDPAFFDWLEIHGQKVLQGDPAATAEAVQKSCRAKADMVAADEFEQKDIRALLNLGHTFGHAIEALGGYDGRVLHGEAVSIGMRMAFDFSEKAGLCPANDAARLRSHLEKTGLPLKAPFPVTADAMIDKMQGDKKNRDGAITLVLARGIGKAFVSRSIEAGLLHAFLEETLLNGGKAKK